MGGTSNYGQVLDALVELIRTGSNPDLLRAQQILLQRMALGGDIHQSRNPAPKNITEVGGYLNLLVSSPEMKNQFLSSTLGISGPLKELNWGASKPVIPFINIDNHRPAGPAQKMIPAELSIRGDFARSFVAAREEINELGGQLPFLSKPKILPDAHWGETGDTDILQLIGRAMELVPGTLLDDPEHDPLALGRNEEDGSEVKLLARVTGEPAQVEEKEWKLKYWSGTELKETEPMLAKMIPVEQYMASAGWYPANPGVLPGEDMIMGGWGRFINITGLIPHTTVLIDELKLLYLFEDITGSALSQKIFMSWDGAEFK